MVTARETTLANNAFAFPFNRGLPLKNLLIIGTLSFKRRPLKVLGVQKSKQEVI